MLNNVKFACLLEKQQKIIKKTKSLYMIVRPTEEITRAKQQKHFKGPIFGEHFLVCMLIYTLFAYGLTREFLHG